MGVLVALSVTGSVCGSTDGSVCYRRCTWEYWWLCLLQEVYVGVLMALSVTGGVHGSTDGSVCYRRFVWEG